jgi:alcohol dehydrogenase
MLAAMIKGKDMVLDEVPKPVLQTGTDVIIKVKSVMICTSELHNADILPPCPPYVFGHEFSGVIEEVGDCVRFVKPGDRVNSTIYPFCGVCDTCRDGVPGRCPNAALLGSGESFGNLPGALAEYVRVPNADSALVKIPDHISFEEAAFVGDILSTGYMCIRDCELKMGQTIAILGAGAVGLCAVQIAKLMSPSKIILLDSIPKRLEIGLKTGATHAVNIADRDPVEAVMEITGGKGVNACVEAVGLPEPIHTACELIGIGGHICIVGSPPPGDIGLPLQDLLFKCATIRIGLTDSGNMRIVMGLLADGKIDPSPLLTHKFPLKDFDTALKTFKGKLDGCIKVALLP